MWSTVRTRPQRWYPAFPGGDVTRSVCHAPPVPTDDAGTDGPAITVAIVEDDPVLRESVGTLVDDAPGLRLVGSGATVAEGLALLATGPDVILVDLALPDGTGLEIVAAREATQPGTKLLVLTVFADVRSVVSAIEAGADGYLLKESDAAMITSAVRTVLDGGAPISPAVASHILARLRTGQRPPTAPAVTLTAKETEVLEALASGKSLKEVALTLGISPHTVGDHVKAIYRKLSVNSRGEAVYKAVQTGLIRIES